MVLSPEELVVKNLFFQFYPFLKIAYVISSHAIAKAMKVIHVIDLSASEAAQWIYLMQRLKLKDHQKKPLLLKITGIHEKKEVLEQMAIHLGVAAQELNLHLQFNAIVSSLENLDLERFPVEKGEPLAISSVLQLHSLLATDDSMANCKGKPTYCRNTPLESMNQSTLKEVLGEKMMNQSPDLSLLSFPLCFFTQDGMLSKWPEEAPT
ncbi:GRAS family protein TF80-like [Lotus japonicus]|uniref:GRAS family protein TF80-like n=1 Tax=Lotus japonicus TaxID=34305 RepID=UPI00258764BB|nr:GRAS family protein TF80-like [Lotus japonicus]